jgi:5-methylcytosine-specific restriction endonuclease McrA
MQFLNRKSIQDTQKLIEKFVPDEETRLELLFFLADAIAYAHILNDSNWNLNLDKNGKFLRLNTGHEYCIQISNENVLILCIKDVLEKELKGTNFNIDFQGYSGSNKIISKNFHDTPDCLVKVPNSIGCIIKYEHIQFCLPLIKRSNRKFIEDAINNTTLLPMMRKAHSVGSIGYLQRITNKKIFNPIYTVSQSELKNFEEQHKNVIKLSDSELERRIKIEIDIPQKINVISAQYVRNPYISEYVKRKSNGICQDCKQPAPFVNRRTGEPYLETHHLIPLSEGGKDTLDNVIALCPNCHRKRHCG